MMGKCAATTKRGTPCKNAAVEGQRYCALHDDWSEDTEAEKAEDRKQKAVENRSTDIDRSLQASPEFQKFEIAKRIAHTLACSNLVPDAYRGQPNDCFVAISMGAEIGLEPFQAIQGIAVIDSKPCLYGDALIGVVRASPKCEWIKETKSDDDLSATCETKRKGEPHTISATYTMGDAQLAGIESKKNWKKHPKRMLQMRARAYCLRDAYPDVLKGLGVVEEMIDHENTPPAITSFDLPETTNAAITDGVGGTQYLTFDSVSHAMQQSESMAQLLAASKDAKLLSEEDQAKLRPTYRQMRDALMETDNERS